jgi:cystathionine beta-lyase
MGRICRENDLIIFSDEIHADLVPTKMQHFPIASLSEEIGDITVTCHSTNKTFNLAGISSGFAVIPNQRLSEKIAHVQKQIGMHAYGNLLGVLASEVAYMQCEDWLDQVLRYLQSNREFLLDYFAQHIPGIHVIPPDGTYLAWLDCRELGMNKTELKNFMLQRAKVWLNDGPTFGTGGVGFQRLNFACPHTTLKEALQRIEQAVNAL